MSLTLPGHHTGSFNMEKRRKHKRILSDYTMPTMMLMVIWQKSKTPWIDCVKKMRLKVPISNVSTRPTGNELLLQLVSCLFRMPVEALGSSDT